MSGAGVGNRRIIYDADTGLWSTAMLSRGRYALAATTLGTKAIFAGGGDGGVDTVDVFDVETGVWTTQTLSQARAFLAATTVGDEAMFAGGFYRDATREQYYSALVDIFVPERPRCCCWLWAQWR